MEILVNYWIVMYMGFYINPCFYLNREPCPQEIALIRGGLIDVESISEKRIKVDLKYSGKDNFIRKDIYGCLNRAYLQPDVAMKLINASDKLHKTHPGFVLLIYDAARPAWAQQALWDNIEKPENIKHVYVADPKRGSIHNYGAAVDLTIADTNGIPLDMGTPFDYFGILAQPRCEIDCLKRNKLSFETSSESKVVALDYDFIRVSIN